MMTRESYRESLDALRADTVEMGERAVSQLETALEALETRDPSLAEAVIESDAALNERYLELEGECIELFALQQPVAGDLRFVAASFKILTDVERVGDLATNLGRYARRADGGAVPEVDIPTIGADARDQLAAALDAYAEGDAAACRAVAARDEELDALCARASERVVRDLIEGQLDPWDAESLMDDVTRVLLTIRDLERVGDHAENIAARALYAAEGDRELVY